MHRGLKTLVPWLLLLTNLSPVYAQVATSEDLLDEIQGGFDANLDPVFNTSWGNANLLSSIASQASGNLNLSTYWSGATQYNSQPINDVALVQIVFDLLVAYPQSSAYINTSTYLNDKLINQVIYNVTKLDTSDYQTPSSLAGRVHTLVRSTVEKLFTSNDEYLEVYEIYHKLYSLRERSLSCKSYWEGPSSFGYTDADTILLNVSSNSVEDTLAALNNVLNNQDGIPNCQKVICSTRQNEPYNGYYSIGEDAVAAKNAINQLDCDNLFEDNAYTAKKIGLCQLGQLNNKIEGAPSAPTGGVASLEEGKTYIESIAPVVRNSLLPLQALLILQITELVDEEINNNAQYAEFKSASFSTILASPAPATSLNSCTQPLPDGVKTAACSSSSGTTSSNAAMEQYLNNLLGLNGNLAAIIPGLSLGLSTNLYTTNHSNEFALLIAGTYVNLQEVTRNQVTQYWEEGSPSQTAIVDNSKKLLLSKSSQEAISGYRTTVLDKYNDARNLKRNKIIQSLLVKSASSDIINMMYNENSKMHFYRKTGNEVFGKTMLQSLKESSNWRLNDNSDDNWLSSLSSMSNVSLLREIVILLAEIEHLQYIDYLTLQQSNVLAAIRSSIAPFATQPLLLNMLSDASIRYLAGISNTENSTGLPSSEVPTEEEQAAIMEGVEDQIASASNLPQW